KGDQYLNVTVGGKPYTISQLRESFYRPDLVKVALAGQRIEGLKKIADIKPPPSVAIINTPASVSSDQITVSLEVKDQGGGIGDVRLYLNGTAVVLDQSGRALRLKTETPSSARTFAYPLQLISGKNSLRAIAFNADNTMQSTDALFEIDAQTAVKKPALHALVVGIQEYENPKLTLKYPVADANLFADTLKERAAGLFDIVTITRLTTRQETTSASITAALNKMRTEVGPNDLFVFYVASHGTVDDGEYFLITSNVGATSTEKLKRDALSQNSLKELISNIPAAKKLIVLDTCNAGKLGDAIQMAMLTRGMSEDTAFKVLSRAVGSTILSAANSQQEALEGYRDHGLFTYVISEGLQGKADLDKDGFIKTTELANYIEDEVPDLAEKVFHHKQYPVASPSGQGFPVARVR
ncbi:MAG: caspase family protein, partial [Gallionellaceae bacterium]